MPQQVSRDVLNSLLDYLIHYLIDYLMFDVTITSYKIFELLLGCNEGFHYFPRPFISLSCHNLVHFHCLLAVQISRSHIKLRMRFRTIQHAVSYGETPILKFTGQLSGQDRSPGITGAIITHYNSYYVVPPIMLEASFV